MFTGTSGKTGRNEILGFGFLAARTSKSNKNFSEMIGPIENTVLDSM